MNIKPIDLRSLTRYSDKINTLVDIDLGDKWDGYPVLRVWLRFGACEIQKRDSCHYLIAYSNSSEDKDFGSTMVVKIPLYHLRLNRVYNGSAQFDADIAVDKVMDFFIMNKDNNSESIYKCVEGKNVYITITPHID